MSAHNRVLGQHGGKWGLIVALLVVAVIGWQWHTSHRAEQTRRKLAATERMVELEQQRALRLRGGDRLDAALSSGNFADWQRAAVGVRSPELFPTKLEDPEVLYREITGACFAELERKLRAVAGALAGNDGDWEEVNAVLDQAAALLVQAEAAEARIAACLASPVWATAGAAQVEEALKKSFLKACLPWLASSRAALLVGDASKLDDALAKLAWLFDQPRLRQIGELRTVSDALAKQLAEVIRRPVGASGDGPSAWLLAESAAVEETWTRADAAMDVARWERANGRARQLLEIGNEAKAAARKLEDEEADARGVVPVGIWRAQFAKLQDFEQRWWALDLADADGQLKSILGTEEQRGRWIAEVGPTKELQKRWQQVPEVFRKQAAPDAEARLSEAVANESIDFASFLSAQAEFGVATKAAGEVWLATSLVDLSKSLLTQARTSAIQQCLEIESWFGQDERLQPIREARAAAAAAAAAAIADPVAIVLVIDRSGSMGTRVIGGGTKMSYAKTSARQTALALKEGDEVALITFGDDDQARVELPLTSAVDRDAVEQGIARLAHSNERTYLDHGLVRARELLLQSKCAVRHVVVLTDGEVWDQELTLRKRTNAMRLEGLTVSMVSIVDEGTLATFQGMAERVVRDGGGLFLAVRDARVVPQLISAEVARLLKNRGRIPK